MTTKPKTYEIVISEVITYKYRIKTSNIKKALERTMSRHEDDDLEPIEKSIDQCHVVNYTEVTK